MGSGFMDNVKNDAYYVNRIYDDLVFNDYLLQPLIENAVMYGLDSPVERLQVSVTVRLPAPAGRETESPALQPGRDSEEKG